MRVGRPSEQCCLAVWSRWLESSTRLGGFRALKKTTEAPYTTKVNYRMCTSRGTTPTGYRPAGSGPAASCEHRGGPKVRYNEGQGKVQHAPDIVRASTTEPFRRNCDIAILLIFFHCPERVLLQQVGYTRYTNLYRTSRPRRLRPLKHNTEGDCRGCIVYSAV